MFDVAVAVDAQGFLVGVKLVGYIHDPHILKVGLLAVRDRRVAPQAVLVHQLVTGGEFSRDELARARVAIRAGHGGGMDAGRKPQLRRLLILMAAQTEKRMGSRKPHQPEPRDGGTSARRIATISAQVFFGNLGIAGIFIGSPPGFRMISCISGETDS